jgi:hypothetical protein
MAVWMVDVDVDVDGGRDDEVDRKRSVMMLLLLFVVLAVHVVACVCVLVPRRQPENSLAGTTYRTDPDFRTSCRHLGRQQDPRQSEESKDAPPPHSRNLG